MHESIIRQATHNDNDAIAKVNVTCWQESYQSFFSAEYLASLSWQDRSANRKQFQIDPTRVSFVAELDNQIIGFGDIGPARIIESIANLNQTYFELYAMYVLKDYQRLGIGKQIFTVIEEHLAISHIKNIVVWTLLENEKAIKFYQSLGFKQTMWAKQTNIDNKYYDEIALIKLYND